MNFSESDLRNIIMNPFYAIQIDPSLCVEHPTLVSKEDWIAANAQCIKKMGAEAYLRRLLALLEGQG